jgi:hypothetical protein
MMQTLFGAGQNGTEGSYLAYTDRGYRINPSLATNDGVLYRRRNCRY